MKRGAVIFMLGALNVVLIGVVAWQFVLLRSGWAARETVLPSAIINASRSSSGLETQDSAETRARSTPNIPTNLPSPPPNRPVFDWRQVESPDYRTYIQNLRATGCPEQTVRDIVTADVVQAYAAKRLEVAAAAYRDFKYWSTDPSEAGRRDELQRQRRELGEEMGSALEQLLGDGILPPDTSREWRAAVLEQQLAFLPADKREAARKTLLRFADNNTQIVSLVENHQPTSNPDELRRIVDTYDAEHEELSRILTPEEYEQLQMSVSWTAANVRKRLANFHPNEEEFRMIFREWWAQDKTLAKIHAVGPPDPGNLHEAVYARIREQLGNERYEKYVSSWKPRPSRGREH